ncbi:MAG: hypothetical protein V3T83_20410 [Acidobacteriota bacterium]
MASTVSTEKAGNDQYRLAARRLRLVGVVVEVGCHPAAAVRQGFDARKAGNVVEFLAAAIPVKMVALESAE